MFIEIKGHKEIFYSHECEAVCMHESSYSKLSYSFLQNINQVTQIYFGKLNSSEKTTDKEEWEKIDGYDYISFYITENSEDLYESFTLFFGKSAMGEYDRIKRIIEQETLK